VPKYCQLHASYLYSCFYMLGYFMCVLTSCPQHALPLGCGQGIMALMGRGQLAITDACRTYA
jgi:hypothetical protein